jgi:hypothetical protein
MNRHASFILFCVLPLLASSGCKERDRLPTDQEAPRYGALMTEVGRRFEMIGKAAAAGRWELAAFELHELEEAFEELSGARQPEHPDGVNLAALEEAFSNTHPPELRIALEGKDLARVETAFARTAATCNGCHRETGHGFIEIPSQPGAAVPRLDPVP